MRNLGQISLERAGLFDPFYFKSIQGRGSEDDAIASWFETAWEPSQPGATAKRWERKGGDHVDSRKVLPVL